MEKVLDCMGLACPLPVIKTKKAFEEFTEPGVIEVHVDNNVAVENLTRLAAKYGYAMASEQKGEKEYRVRIEVKPDKKEAGAPVPAQSGKTAIVFASNRMGIGASPEDDPFGGELVKSFIFSLTNVDPVPDYMIFYNSGAYLTAEGSPVLQDLKSLSDAGVKIMTCGLCAGHYNVKDKIAVGVISNMYEIADTLMSCGKVIKP